MLYFSILIYTLIITPPPKYKISFGGNGDWSIDPMDIKTMNSLIKDWTNIRIRNDIPQDTEYMLKWKPVSNNMQLCLALTKDNIYYAVAQINERFEKNDTLVKKYIHGICVSPDHHDTATILMEQLVLNDYKMEDYMENLQPRWYIAYSFMK